MVRSAKKYDRLFAMDREMLFQFLENTQPEVMDALRKVYKDDLEETLVNYINSEMTKKGSCLISVLKHGIEISNQKLELMYTMPATTFNQDLVDKCQKNIFSVMEEVWASDKERVDLVIFLNGLAIMSFELKCNAAGQSYEDAIYQYRKERSPKTRLFLFKAGCLVNFAMDLEEVYMTTRLTRDTTNFLPFNMGNGEGVNAGAGNPIYENKFSVSYMWEDILTKETLLDLLGRFIFLETKEEKDEDSGKKKQKETLIFPRYHQLDVIRQLMGDVLINKTSQNYLIQHSAGSGKTNSIAWLAYRLSSLHDADNKMVYDNVIIVTTIQKFPYIVDSVAGLKEKKFAVIIDEAHSSTAGKDMAAITKSLGAGEQEYMDSEEMIVDEIVRHGKQGNVSMFAFTATPKPTTLQLFGRINKKGAA